MGGTLLDLLIGVTLSLLIFGATIVTLNQGFTAFRLSQEKTKAQEAARIALEKVAVYTRSASETPTITDECGNPKGNKGKAIATTKGNGNKYGLFNKKDPTCGNSEILTIKRRNSSGNDESLTIQKDGKSLKVGGNVIGYTVEDATFAVLGKAGKLGQPQPVVDSPIGGSAAVNQPINGASKKVSEMSRDEKRNALLEAEKRGEISLS